MLLFDRIRKKHVTMTPEENVRQSIINYLTAEKGYPHMLISVETSLKYANMKKRTDLLINDSAGRPLMLVECKAPDVVLTNKVFEQIAIYNLAIKAPYMLVTNGIKNYCMSVATESTPPRFLSEIPEYSMIQKIHDSKNS